MSSTLQHQKSHHAAPVIHSANGNHSCSDRSKHIVPANYFVWKHWVERVVAVLLLLPGIPMIVALAALMRLTSRGPGIYRQIRVGLHGRKFMMYKIRTMRADAEKGTGPVWAKQGDSRVTRVGRVLRTLHLDELPQLFNVLKGEMALIGPRPERPEFTQQLVRDIPRYLERLSVLPGITGLAQINLPPDTDLDSVRRKLVLDLEYIAGAGFLLDLRMFLCTMVRLIGLHGDTAMRLFRLQRAVPIPSQEILVIHSHNGSPQRATAPSNGHASNGHASENVLAPTAFPESI